ncbi:MAG TPA: hypothetical protein DCP51_08390 [Clostridiales bacterium]|nr:hypothetical protein [Clostridiales bacterium]
MVIFIMNNYIKREVSIIKNYLFVKKFIAKVLLFTFLTLYLFPILSLNSFAEGEVLPFTLDENNTDSQGIAYTLDEKELTAMVSGPFNGNDFILQTIILPDKVVKGVITYTVTSIEESAFNNLEVITSVTISNSIINIGNNAFDGCEGLTNLIIPESVKTIGKHAFAYCEGLTSINISDNVEEIGEGAFSLCIGLTNFTVGSNNIYYSSDINGVLYNKSGTVLIQYPVGKTATVYTVPQGVKSIGNSAFSRCAGLTSINFSTSVTDIGNSSFYNCNGLTSVVFPTGLKNIEESAFEKCSGLINITIPTGAVSIGKNAFKDCTALTNISIPDSITSIGRYAFDNTAWYTNQADGVVYIGKVAYIYKGSMPADTEMTLRTGIKGIADYAFYSCEDLITFTVPSSVVNIGYGVFFYCESLTKIVVEAKNIFYASDNNGILYNKAKTTLIQYPLGNNRAHLIIPSSVNIIGERAFYYCSYLSKITFSNSVAEIGESAFEGCVNFTSIALPNNLKNIGEYAFYYCTSLNEVSIPKSVTMIGSDAFHKCENIVLYVYEGSIAHEYAVSALHSYQFLIDYIITLSDGYATGIEDLQTADDIKIKLKTATIKSPLGVLITGDTLVGTGAIINYNGSNYTVVIKGEINGDGKVNSVDYLLVKRAYLGTYKLSSVKLKAACMENTTLPTSKDYLKIKRHFLGTYSIYE